MNSLIAAAYSVATVSSARQGSLGSLIVAAGVNPSPESITAEKQAEVESTAAILVLKKAIGVVQEEGTDLADLMDQESGIGQNLNTVG